MMLTHKAKYFSLHKKLFGQSFHNVLVILFGLLLGNLALCIGSLPSTWIMGIIVISSITVVSIIIGSLKHALIFVLVLSLSTQIDINPWWSDRYSNINPGVPISLTTIVLMFLYVIWGIESFKRAYNVRFYLHLTIPFCIIILWTGISYFTAKHPSYVLNQYQNVLTSFFLFLYIANFIKSEKDLRLILVCLAMTVALSGIIGICQFFSGGSLNLGFMGEIETQLKIDGLSQINRVSGLLGHSNIFAWMLDGILPVLFISVLMKSPFHFRLLYLLSFILGLIALVLTFSRGGWLSLFISIPFILYCKFKYSSSSQFRRHIKPFILVMISIIIVISPFLPTMKVRLTQDDYGSAYSRIPMAITSLKVIKDNPFFGVGLQNYGFYVLDYSPDTPLWENDMGQPVHNIYLHFAAELGIPALFIFIWILVRIYSMAMRAIKRNDEPISTFSIGLLAGFVGMLLHGMFEPGNLGHPRYTLIIFVGGLLVSSSFSVGKGQFKQRDKGSLSVA